MGIFIVLLELGAIAHTTGTHRLHTSTCIEWLGLGDSNFSLIAEHLAGWLSTEATRSVARLDLIVFSTAYHEYVRTTAGAIGGKRTSAVTIRTSFHHSSLQRFDSHWG